MVNLQNNRKELDNSVANIYKHRRRSSFFGYGIVRPTDKGEIYKRQEIEFYVKKLENEIYKWPEHFIFIKGKLQKFWKQEANMATKTILTIDQKEYLDKAVNAEEYLQDWNKMANEIEEYIMIKEWFCERRQFCINMVNDKVKEDELALRKCLSDITMKILE